MFWLADLADQSK
ncbi:hypothetical protein D043_3963A, partial [Vibrio parahaemolyticus EKP-021]